MRLSNGPAADPRVVFLVGTAHTGKTELAAALREQPGRTVVRRAYFWRNEYGRSGSLSRDRNLNRCLSRLERDEFLRSLGIDRDNLATAAGLGNRSYGGLFLHATAEAARRLAGQACPPDRLVVQIGGLESVATAVSEDLPNATFIHTIRDPRRYFGRSSSQLGRLGWRLSSWSSSATSALSNAREMPDRYLVVRGEDIIESPDEVSALISRHVGGNLSLDQAGDSLSAKGSALPKRRALIVEKLVGHQLEALGYRLGEACGPGAVSNSTLDASIYHLRSRLVFRTGAST